MLLPEAITSSFYNRCKGATNPHPISDFFFFNFNVFHDVQMVEGCGWGGSLDSNKVYASNAMSVIFNKDN